MLCEEATIAQRVAFETHEIIMVGKALGVGFEECANDFRHYRAARSCVNYSYWTWP